MRPALNPSSADDGLYSLLICLYASDLELGTCRIDSLPELPALSGLPPATLVLTAPDAVNALQSARLGYPERPLVLLDARHAPPFAALRLSRLPRSELLVSALPAPALAARLGAQAPSTPDLDRLCWLAGEALPLPSLLLEPAACRVPAAAVSTLAQALAADPLATLPASLEGAVYTRLCVDSPRPLAAGAEVAVATLAARLQPLIEESSRGYPGLDGREVVLHALHGWGGGSARFVEDLIRGDDERHHLLLQAESDADRKLPGVGIALRLRPQGAALRSSPLSAPIAATALRSREIADFLDSVCRDFGVASVLVSSLIGLSLDLLRSGLPTAVVCHDYHPLWPDLHADFGSADFDVSDAALRECVAKRLPQSPFSELRAEAWLALREAYVQALNEAQACLIAPTRAVLDNLLRLAPTLAGLRQLRIPHGLADWPQPQQAPMPPQRPRLRVLVPGRINGGKGEQLLAALVPQLPDDVELVLLGCGAAGMRFLGSDRVHLQLDYAHANLPQRVAALAPDLALLPASVAETFSYTLSELWSLGLPVLATRIGSYAERIEHGRTGLLVDPDATAIARALRFLAANRAALAQLRRQPPSQPSLRDMAQAYREAVSGQAHTYEARRELLGIDAAQRLQLELQQLDLGSALAEAQARLQQLRAEADERAQWARDQEKLAQERTAWAQSQDLRIELQGGQIDGLKRQLQHEKEEAAQLASALEAEQQERDRLARLAAALEQQRDEFEDERNRILASTSWRLTRPLRGARRLLERGLASLGFRRQRAGSLMSRGMRSLRTRGVQGTLQRIRQEVRPELPQTVLALPASAPFEPFALPCPEAPRVSVVIPVYNHLDHSLTCLRSIGAHPSAIAAEIIVVDDCSSDATAETLPQIEGLRYQRNAENLGFIGACNAGAAAARGEYLVFLNNDTAVQPGWLDALIETFETQDRVGLVGAKLIYPDGRLQEAGGIVFNDGSGWNYGRFSDPTAPEHNYLREVDYCSGAAIAIRSELFAEFGGFDAHYAPAYYEDTDLAMKVWARGLRVLYQPKAAVVHFEGVSSGTDTSSGIKAYQVVNQQKFLQRWGERLQSHPAPGTPIPIARQHRDTRHVLIVDATTPAPDQDSGSVRMVNLMRLLRAEGCAVTFFADNRAHVERYTSELQQLGVEVLWHPFLSDVPGWFAENGRRFDLILLSRHYIACQYVDLARLHAPQARLVFDTVDLHYLREQREAELAGREDLRRQAAQTRDKELALINGCDITLVVSPVEQALLAREAPSARVDILSNVHEVFGCRRPYEARSGLVFMGGYQHTPNVDAVLWFADAILPLIQAQAPEIEFHVVGSKAPAQVQALGERPGIVFHGFVPDIAPFMDDCRLAVAPLRYGAGVKGKVNMSMSYGQPVIATPIAIEGMHAEAGVDVLVAETADDFAAAVLRAYRDPQLWQQLSERGLANVEQHFSFDAARRAVRALFRS